MHNGDDATVFPIVGIQPGTYQITFGSIAGTLIVPPAAASS